MSALDDDLDGCLDIDPYDYPGGVAVWAALAPVFDTSGRPSESGIHVHARQEVDLGKEIDATYPAVAVRSRQERSGERASLVTRDAAINYYLSRFLSRRVECLRCPRCNEIHLDCGWFAIHPHQRHLCEYCGRLFTDHDSAVSNPVALVREALGGLNSNLEPIRACASLDIRQAEYPGGVQIWASNPAIIWTAPRSEQTGIHVHLFNDPCGCPVIDETFNEVRIDGVGLDEAMVHHLMAQQAAPHLEGKIETLNCPTCGGSHFDRGELAFEPHPQHTCEHCGIDFRPPGRWRLSISNPLLATLELLRHNAHRSVY